MVFVSDGKGDTSVRPITQRFFRSVAAFLSTERPEHAETDVASWD